MTTTPKIIAVNVRPPIPVRDFDWVAYVDGQEEGCSGHGATKAGALCDIAEMLADSDDEDSRWLALHVRIDLFGMGEAA